ncbi:MAG: rubrerythrin [Chloroflexi bacterium RBG_16_56_11]|nr:MAG: rubrerythrin [Chloroflexi bacterium RBG_16_56_11]
MPYETDGNLQHAFGGESMANRRYTFFAEKADKEGYPGVARLFRAVAEAETVHARNHMLVMDAIGNTRENLLAASIGEHQEFTRMYPPFIEKAQEERNARAEKTFDYANSVEKVHHALYEAALQAVKEGKNPEEKTYFVCQVCGNTVTGAAPDKCPICGAGANAFKKVE